MKIIRPSFEIIDEIDGMKILKKIELCGRVCYKSEDKITEDSCKKFVKNIIQNGHESVLEHVSISVRFICDRGISHEIVRHRIASYSQESTRYCNYGFEGFGGEITVIEPFLFYNPEEQKRDELEAYLTWYKSMVEAEKAYFLLLNYVSPQWARSVLPNSLKTELIMTANLREWRHFLKLRTSHTAHPQMRELTIPLLNEFKRRIPVVFDDIIP